MLSGLYLNLREVALERPVHLLFAVLLLLLGMRRTRLMLGLLLFIDLDMWFFPRGGPEGKFKDLSVSAPGGAPPGVVGG